MNPFEMVVAIIAIVSIAGVLRAKYGYRRRKDGSDFDTNDAADYAENRQLRDDVRALKERIVVLERLATEDNEAKRIDREIEKLRDRT